MTEPEYSNLPPLERIKHYLDLAGDARKEAEKCEGHARQSYLLMAERWEQLATTTAASLKPKK